MNIDVYAAPGEHSSPGVVPKGLTGGDRPPDKVEPYGDAVRLLRHLWLSRSAIKTASSRNL
jgi:hypothetical protein